MGDTKNNTFNVNSLPAMKPLRTEIKATALSSRLRRSDPILCMGSCFATEMGNLLSLHKYSVLQNPGGIIYNPISLVGCLTDIRKGRFDRLDDLLALDDRVVSLAHHGQFTASDLSTLQSNITTMTREAHQFTRGVGALVLSLGTAHVFARVDNGRIVANCHRLPASFFRRRRLSVGEIVECLDTELDAWQDAFPELQIILTVSPIRHLRDGLVSNQRSKSTLILALADLVEKRDNRHYFPAYEMLMDDLRDYRFYQDDLSHPSNLAIEYVWQQFREACLVIDEELDRALEKIARSLAHRARDEESIEHQNFLLGLRDEIEKLQMTYVDLDFKAELELWSELVKEGESDQI